MKKPLQVLVQCVGISPLMMDRMSEEAVMGLVTGVRKPQQKDRAVEDIAAEKIYRDENGRISVSSAMLVKALISAGRNVKNGRWTISTAETTTLFSFMRLRAEFLPLTNIPTTVEKDSAGEKAFWTVDLRRGVGYQAKKPTAVGIVRPKFKSWAFDAEIIVDGQKCSVETVRALFDEAGLTQGIGSFRPNRRGPFGMFEVAKWEVTELPASAEVTHLGKKAA